MPVLSIGDIKYIITLHKKNILQLFWIGKFFRQYWENLEEIGSKKTPLLIFHILSLVKT